MPLSVARRSKDIFTTWSVLDTAGYTAGIVTGLQALGSAFFRPNVLMLTLSDEIAKDVELRQLIRESKRFEVGVVLLGMHPHAATGCEEQAPQSDMDVLGMPRDPDAIDFLRETVKRSRSSCIFTQDSGHESALA